MSKTPRNNEIRTTDDAILFLKNLPGFASYHRYFETKLAGDFAFELAKFMSKRETELTEARAEIERLKHQLEDESMRADGMTTAHAEAGAKNYRQQELIEQMRVALLWLYRWVNAEIEHFQANTPDNEIIKEVEAALSAAERGEG